MLAMERILIAGGMGFIGRNLISVLQKTETEIVVAGRTDINPSIIPSGVSYFHGDTRDRRFCRRILEGVDIVVDLVSQIVPGTPPYEEIPGLISSVEANLVLMEEASNGKVKRYLYVSSGGAVYGNPISIPILENFRLEPISPYGIGKVMVEQVAQHFVRRGNLPILIARPGNPYGNSGCGNFHAKGIIDVIARKIINNQTITIIGDGAVVRDFLHVDDLVSGLVSVLSMGQIGEAYNIGTGCGTTIRDALAILIQKSGKQREEVRIDYEKSRVVDVNKNVLSYHKLESRTAWVPKIKLDFGIEKVFSRLRD